MKLGLILMASGFGRRFGGDKLFSEVEGIPLYLRALNTYAAVPFEVAVVVSRSRDILDAAVARGFIPVYNGSAEEGISASIRLGMARMADVDGVLFAVCDQPWLTAESVKLLLAAFAAEPTRPAALAWEGKRGNPVIFPPSLFAPLSALTGDTGGSAVLRAYGGPLTLASAASPRELADIDAPSDLSGPSKIL